MIARHLLALGALVALVVIGSLAAPEPQPLPRPCSDVLKLASSPEEWPCTECCEAIGLRMHAPDWTLKGRCVCYAPWPRSRQSQEAWMRYVEAGL